MDQKYFHKIREYFNGDVDKTWKWFKEPNANLGGVSPLFMIKCGREKKLMQFIDNQLEGNYP